MTNNEVYDGRGEVIGFQCDTCDQVKTKMWGNTCNECRAKYEDKKDAPSGCRPQVVPTSTPERYRHVADQLESVGMEDNEYVRDEVVSMLRCAETQARELAALRTKVREFQAAARKVRVGDSPEVWALVQGVDALLAPPIPPLAQVMV